jgi:hypothetical protein
MTVNFGWQPHYGSERQSGTLEAGISTNNNESRLQPAIHARSRGTSSNDSLDVSWNGRLRADFLDDAPPEAVVSPPEQPQSDAARLDAEIEKLLKLEGERGETKGNLENRARFNLSAEQGIYNLDELKLYLSHREMTKTPEEQRELDRRVLDLAKRLDVKYSNRDINSLADAKKGKEGPLSEADFATKVIIASGMLTLLKNRPDLLEEVLKDDGGLKILIGIQPPKKAATGLAVADNRMLFDTMSVSRNTIIHELTHLIDATGEKSHDGTLYRLPEGEKSLKNQYNEARDKVKKAFKETGQRPPGIYDDNAFADDKEFLAEMGSLFITNPKGLNQISSQIYNVFREYFGLDPLSYSQ